MHINIDIIIIGIGLPVDFQYKGTTDLELRRIFNARIGTETEEFLTERTSIENLRRQLPPTTDYDRKQVQDMLVGRLIQVLGELEDKLDVDAGVLLYSKQKNVFGNQLKYYNTGKQV